MSACLQRAVRVEHASQENWREGLYPQLPVPCGLGFSLHFRGSVGVREVEKGSKQDSQILPYKEGYSDSSMHSLLARQQARNQ